MRFVLKGAAVVVAFAVATVGWSPPPASGAAPTTPAPSFEGVPVSSISALRPAAVCSALPTPAPDADGPPPANVGEPCTEEQLDRADRYLASFCPGGGWAEVWCHASGAIRVHVHCGEPPDAVIHR